MSARRIQAITFDLDDTLYDNRPVLERAEETLHRWLERHYPRLTATFDREALRSMRRELLEAEPHLRHDLSTLRRRALAHAARATGYDAALAEPAFRVFHAERQRVTLYRDVLPALRTLRPTYLLGSLTNGNADARLIGLGDFFAFSLQAEKAGAAKPEPAMFLEALRRAGVPPKCLLHVGDDPVADVEGAARLGIGTVWINRNGADWERESEPDFVIGSLSELPAILASEEAVRTP